MKITAENNKVLSKKTKKRKWNFSLRRKINLKKKEAFYREFSILLRSGIDFNTALLLLEKQEQSELLVSILQEVRKKIIKGKSLYVALEESGNFTPYEVFSIKIGEETRQLTKVFDQLNIYFKRKLKIRRQIISALTYPLLVIVITMGVLYFMLSYVVPMFSSIFSQFGKDLPAITQIVINISRSFKTFSAFLAGSILMIFLFHTYMKKNQDYLLFVSNLLLKIPLVGNLIKKIYLARFCQSLSLLLSAKTPLLNSLDLVNKILVFAPFNTSIVRIKKKITKGESFYRSLSEEPLFPAKLISLTQIGEETNELDLMYSELSQQYEEEIEHYTKVLGTVIEPVMIVIIGSIVGFIMVALYSPIFNLSKILEN